MFPASRRTLLDALIVSLLIHAALLASLADLYPTRPGASTSAISVVISHNTMPVKEIRPDSPPARPPRSADPARHLNSSKHVAERRAVEQRVVSQGPADFRAEPQAPALSPEHRAATQFSPDRATRGGGSAASTTDRNAEISADDVRQYRLSLAVAARRFKRYPALAREHGWEGAVEIVLRGDALMPVPEVVLANSSGRGILDEQALEMVRRAAQVTMVPDGLRGREFRVSLPVRFSLDGDQ